MGNNGECMIHCLGRKWVMIVNTLFKTKMGSNSECVKHCLGRKWVVIVNA